MSTENKTADEGSEITNTTDNADLQTEIEKLRAKNRELLAEKQKAKLKAQEAEAAADEAATQAAERNGEKHLTTGTIAPANMFGWDAVIAGRKQLGDLGNELTFMIAHSDVVNNLRAKEPNAFVPASQTDIGLEKYGKYAIVETDNFGVAGTANFPIYTTVFAGAGLLGYGAGSFGETALAQVRDEAAGDWSGQETIVSRRRYILHPFGFTNKVAAANGVSQTNAELATAATWDRVVSRKSIPLVAIKTNG